MPRKSVRMKIVTWFVVLTVSLGMIFFFGTYFIFQPAQNQNANREQDNQNDFLDDMEKVNFETADKVNIVANWWPHEGAKQAILLLHMMPSTKESWDGFAVLLNQFGFSALAIDLRGHGESTEKRDLAMSLNYQRFSDEEHQGYKRDVEAAVNFLRQKGFGDENIALVGASVGANLVVNYLAENIDVKTAVALSPGLDYRSIKTEEAVENLGPDQSLFIAVSENDQYAYQSVTILDKLLTKKKEIKILKGSEHGTNIFISNPEVAQDIIKWLQEVYQRPETRDQ
jgi:esterase/lipase